MRKHNLLLVLPFVLVHGLPAVDESRGSKAVEVQRVCESYDEMAAGHGGTA